MKNNFHLGFVEKSQFSAKIFSYWNVSKINKTGEVKCEVNHSLYVNSI